MASFQKQYSVNITSQYFVVNSIGNLHYENWCKSGKIDYSVEVKNIICGDDNNLLNSVRLTVHHQKKSNVFWSIDSIHASVVGNRSKFSLQGGVILTRLDNFFGSYIFYIGTNKLIYDTYKNTIFTDSSIILREYRTGNLTVGKGFLGFLGEGKVTFLHNVRSYYDCLR